MPCNQSELEEYLTERCRNMNSTDTNVTLDRVFSMGGTPILKDDAAWILANAFLILTMQTGFGMLEAGTVSSKNVANIMVKNVVDVSIGGLTYWSIGYALSFGVPGNWFCGYGNFFVTSTDEQTMGSFYAHYVFQFSFATAATTIVSGAVAERMKLTSYMVYSCLNVFVYCIPVCWAWNELGFLKKLGFFDFAGAAVVHLSGGSSALVAAMMLGPRLGRFEKDGSGSAPAMSSPVTALTGTFMLWWAWLAFNCGSSYGVNNNLWKIAAKAGVCTINGSIGGSLMVMLTWHEKNYHFDVGHIIQSVLGGLIGITACCSVITPAESILVGAIGGFIGVMVCPLLAKLKIDDPVGAIPVHMCSAIWSTVAVGIFGQNEFGLLNGYSGFMRGGGFQLFGVQLLGTICILAWSIISTFLIMLVMKVTFGIRMSAEHEILGADWTEHKIRSENVASKLEATLNNIQDNKLNPDLTLAKVLLELMSGGRWDPVDSRIRNVAGGSDPDKERAAPGDENKNHQPHGTISTATAGTVRAILEMAETLQKEIDTANTVPATRSPINCFEEAVTRKQSFQPKKRNNVNNNNTNPTQIHPL